MTKIRGIEGIFIRSSEPDKLEKWYKEIFGFEFDDYSASIIPSTQEDVEEGSYSVFGFFPEDTDYFEPSEKDVMINFRVDNITDFIEELKDKGIEVEGPKKFEQGTFAWIMDPEGRKIEIWEMP